MFSERKTYKTQRERDWDRAYASAFEDVLRWIRREAVEERLKRRAARKYMNKHW